MKDVDMATTDNSTRELTHKSSSSSAAAKLDTLDMIVASGTLGQGSSMQTGSNTLVRSDANTASFGIKALPRPNIEGV